MRFWRTRRVRLHMKDDTPSLEGFLTGTVDNHYRLAKPAILEREDRTVDLSGEAWVARERVLFVQVLG